MTTTQQSPPAVVPDIGDIVMLFANSHHYIGFYRGRVELMDASRSPYYMLEESEERLTLVLVAAVAEIEILKRRS